MADAPASVATAKAEKKMLPAIAKRAAIVSASTTATTATMTVTEAIATTTVMATAATTADALVMSRMIVVPASTMPVNRSRTTAPVPIATETAHPVPKDTTVRAATESPHTHSAAIMTHQKRTARKNASSTRRPLPTPMHLCVLTNTLPMPVYAHAAKPTTSYRQVL